MLKKKGKVPVQGDMGKPHSRVTDELKPGGTVPSVDEGPSTHVYHVHGVLDNVLWTFYKKNLKGVTWISNFRFRMINSRSEPRSIEIFD